MIYMVNSIFFDAKSRLQEKRSSLSQNMMINHNKEINNGSLKQNHEILNPNYEIVKMLSLCTSFLVLSIFWFDLVSHRFSCLVILKCRIWWMQVCRSMYRHNITLYHSSADLLSTTTTTCVTRCPLTLHRCEKGARWLTRCKSSREWWSLASFSAHVQSVSHYVLQRGQSEQGHSAIERDVYDLSITL